MKVTVSVHGRWHGFELANGLHKRGLLETLITTYPAFAARRFLAPGVRLQTRPWLELRRRLYDRFSLGTRPDTYIAKAFAKSLPRNMKGDSDIFVGWSSATLEAIGPAQAAGMKVVIERGSSHIGHQRDVLARAYDQIGLPHMATDPEIIDRELAEYDLADAIAVPSRFAAATFIERGIDAAKLIINPYGVDLSRFSPGTNDVQALPRIVFVGTVGVRKGVSTLLQAFKGLEKLAELHLIGPVEKGFEEILSQYSSDNLHVRGALPGPKLADELNRANIFCLPSLEEGFPLSMLQAMASGLAIVTSPQSGAADIISEGIEGNIVEAQNIEALHGALLRLVEQPDQCQSMGAAARQRVASGYSWQDYGDRAAQAYDNLMNNGD